MLSLKDARRQGSAELDDMFKSWRYRGTVLLRYAIMQNCVRLCHAWKCISEAMLTIMVLRSTDLKAASKIRRIFGGCRVGQG